MSGVRPYLSYLGPETYKVTAAVKGGQLVEAVAGGVRPATAGSTTVMGVAEIDAKPLTNPVTTDADGFETINVSPLPEHTVAGFGRYPVTYTANATFGQALTAGANGTVTPIAADADPRTIVGYCDEPAGVTVAVRAVGNAIIRR